MRLPSAWAISGPERVRTAPCLTHSPARIAKQGTVGRGSSPVPGPNRLDRPNFRASEPVRSYSCTVATLIGLGHHELQHMAGRYFRPCVSQDLLFNPPCYREPSPQEEMREGCDVEGRLEYTKTRQRDFALGYPAHIRAPFCRAPLDDPLDRDAHARSTGPGHQADRSERFLRCHV